MKYIPFYKPYIGKEEEDEVIDTLRNGWLTSGEKTALFEKLFKEFIGVKYALLVNSGTSALHLAIKSIDIPKNKKVVVPVFTFCATAHILEYEGIEPIFVDVSKKDFLICEEILDNIPKKDIYAVIVVDYGGQIPEIDKIRRSFSHKVWIIEDAAHSFPAWREKIIVGKKADITAFSFYATKPITTGEGGMLITDIEKIYKKAKILRLHGIDRETWERKNTNAFWQYDVKELGYKYNLSDINASIGIAQLKKAIWMFRKREEIAMHYNKLLKEIDEVILYKVADNSIPSWHLYPILLDINKLKISRDEFIMLMKERNIETSVHFIPLYHFTYYKRKYKLTPKMFPNSDWIYKRVVSLPIYPTLRLEDVEYIVENIADILKKYRR